MSQENVDIARHWCEAMGASSEATQAAITQFADPDVDFYPVGKFPESAPCHGRAEFSHFMSRFQESYSRSEWPIDKVIAVGDDRVIARANLKTEGRGSGMELEGEVYICFWFRHGRFFRIENHVTLNGAEHALGLERGVFDATGLSE